MLDRSNRTFICSVVFLDIAEYSRKPVAEQIRLKDRFNALIAEAIKDIAVNDRIVLDTGDGAAISFLGDPEDALFVAISIRDAAGARDGDGPPAIPIRIGINLGPIRLIKDINGQPNIIGDGINVAQRVMGFAQPGQILASRSYHEVVSCLSDDYARLFSYEGYRTDKHVRAHDIYAVGQPGRDLREFREAGRGKSPGDADTLPLSQMARKAKNARRKSRLRWAALAVAVVAILATGGLIRSFKHRDTGTEVGAAGVRIVPPITPRVENGSTAPPKVVTPQEAEATDPVPAGTPAAQLLVQVLPWGEVYVDGKLMGVSPPLRVVDVKAGRHVVELRNTGFPPHTELVVARPAEKIRIRHRFRQEQAP